jgi:DNA-binding XRE family transcriptional regulator
VAGPVAADIVSDMTAPPRRSVFPGFDRVDGARHPLIDELVGRRHAAGLTQADVARLMGTSQPAVARLEAGSTDLRLSTVARYAEAVGHEVSWQLLPDEEDRR